ncbi:muscarinic acetylcholine receptor M5-like [Strongylocentrotus purpuratus]|uniref:G-protein coupled receptors family 1 profile domain-containing protein n=1 Tax=Strongylocentrotus purpuratus TaxID=7668 RepID=A0A7M7N6H9_STRPU|nr:muscarinic acetylcholine receptor M5-like [Strongylocentrotus purpuratus]
MDIVTDITTFISNTENGPTKPTIPTPSTPDITSGSTSVFCVELLISIITMSLNVLILRAFHIEKRLRTYPNWYILNITISDLLVGFIMAIRSTFALYNQWIFGPVLYHLFVGVQNTVLGVSVLGIIAICVDRYVATAYPLEHFRRRKKSIANIANGITWVVSTAFWIPLVTVWHLVEPTEFTSRGKYKMNYIENKYIVNAVTVARIGIPSFLIIAFYVSIHFKIKAAGIQRLSGTFGQSRKHSRSTGSEVTYTSQCDDLHIEASVADLRGNKRKDSPKATALAQFDVSVTDKKGEELEAKGHQKIDLDVRKDLDVDDDVINLAEVNVEGLKDQSIDIGNRKGVDAKYHQEHDAENHEEDSIENHKDVEVNQEVGMKANYGIVVQAHQDNDIKVHTANSFKEGVSIISDTNIHGQHADFRVDRLTTNLPKQDKLQIPSQCPSTGAISSKLSGPQTDHSKQRRLAPSDFSKVMRTLTFIILAFFVTWLPGTINLIFFKVPTFVLVCDG